MHLKFIFNRYFNKNQIFLKNLFSLGIIQIANYILPLFTIPYLLRIVGFEKYGELAFATAFTSYFLIFTDFGFNISATRLISIHRDNLKKIHEIFNSVFIIKLIILSISLLFFLLFIIFFDRFNNNIIIYFFSFLTIIGQFLFPVWFFQGLERLQYVSFVNLIIKLISTVSIFLIIKKPNDYIYVPLITSFGYIFAGSYTIVKIRKDYDINFILIDYKTLKYYFNHSMQVFKSNLFITLYTISNTFILGLFCNNYILGQFSIAEKIILTIKSMYQPFSQSLFPLLANKFIYKKNQAFKLLNRIILFAIPTMALITTLLFIFSKSIIHIISGNHEMLSIKLFQVMSFIPFLVILSNLSAIQGLYNLGKANLVNKYIIFVSSAHIIILPFVIDRFQALGLSFTLLFTELTITFLSLYYYKNEYKKININNSY